MKKWKLLICLIALGIFTKLEGQESKALKHVLLFDWSEEATEIQKDEVLNLFYGLVAKVDGMHHTRVEKLIKSSEEFDVVIFMTFENETSLQAYEKHPDHIKIF
ncbi:Dabb family protein [Croceivirga thetidis]|uniref:Dabb family protein n=1 Tax=Croceivirga thetidis TaxID=2721623 RepID=A0ABX1GS35_9FLAO|nr:Dabb family protein [Croceivirga thetidis]NKI32754.1 Dabb family protein [Croceivirga thetidis]